MKIKTWIMSSKCVRLHHFAPKFQKFPGGACPRTPLAQASCARQISHSLLQIGFERSVNHWTLRKPSTQAYRAYHTSLKNKYCNGNHPFLFIKCYPPYLTSGIWRTSMILFTVWYEVPLTLSVSQGTKVHQTEAVAIIVLLWDVWRGGQADAVW